MNFKISVAKEIIILKQETRGRTVPRTQDTTHQKKKKKKRKNKNWKSETRGESQNSAFSRDRKRSLALFRLFEISRSQNQKFHFGPKNRIFKYEPSEKCIFDDGHFLQILGNQQFRQITDGRVSKRPEWPLQRPCRHGS
tara:strand:+ start:275 stop:691 length:417 start_codon:yes stop_codon:yes gene_type:complete